MYKKLYYIYYFLCTKFKNFLNHIKCFPWFSVLLVLLLGWAGYQTTREVNSPFAVGLRHSIAQIKKAYQSFQAKEAQSSLPSLKKSQKKAPSHSSVVLPLETSAKPSPDSKEKSVVTSIESSIMPEKNEKRLTQLEENLKKTEAELGQLKADKLLLKKQLDSMRPQLENIHQALHAQAQQLSEINVKQEAVQEIEAEPKSDTSKNTARHYSVYATIQGRAWLNTPEGKIITVRTGSVLSPFGTVQMIDTESSQVYFDQGYVMGPSENDA